MVGASKKSKTSRFPVARIKKIMQMDEEVGKLASATPVMISKSIECFMGALLGEASKEAQKRGSKKLTAYHLNQNLLTISKQSINANEQFDFLRELVSTIPDPTSGQDSVLSASSASAYPGGPQGQGQNAAAGPSRRRTSAQVQQGAGGAGFGEGAVGPGRKRVKKVKDEMSGLAQGQGQAKEEYEEGYGHGHGYGYGSGQGEGQGQGQSYGAGQWDGRAQYHDYDHDQGHGHGQGQGRGNWSANDRAPENQWVQGREDYDHAYGVSGGGGGGMPIGGPEVKPNMGIGNWPSQHSGSGVGSGAEMGAGMDKRSTSRIQPGGGTGEGGRGMFDDYEDDEDDY